MGRASNAKKQRRAQLEHVVAVPAKSLGGRPRVHENAAARTRAYRLRKKAGAAVTAAGGPPESDSGQADLLAWFESPGHLAWLADGEKRFGEEWLDAQLEGDAELILGEGNLS